MSSPVAGELPPLAAADHSLVVHYLAPDNPVGQPVTFEVKLEGSADGWISTGTTGSVAGEDRGPSDQRRSLPVTHRECADIVFRVRVGPPVAYDSISPAIQRVTGYAPAEFYAAVLLRSTRTASRLSAGIPGTSLQKRLINKGCDYIFKF